MTSPVSVSTIRAVRLCVLESSPRKRIGKRAYNSGLDEAIAERSARAGDGRRGFASGAAVPGTRRPTAATTGVGRRHAAGRRPARRSAERLRRGAGGHPAAGNARRETATGTRTTTRRRAACRAPRTAIATTRARPPRRRPGPAGDARCTPTGTSARRWGAGVGADFSAPITDGGITPGQPRTPYDLHGVHGRRVLGDGVAGHRPERAPEDGDARVDADPGRRHVRRVRPRSGPVRRRVGRAVHVADRRNVEGR